MILKLMAPFYIFIFALLTIGCAGNQHAKNDPREENRVIDSASINYVTATAKNDDKAVFVFTKDFPETKGLKNKKLIIKPLNQDISINYDEYMRKDYMGPIYILLPAYYTGIRASVILKCFPAYKGFKLKDVSENYVVYYTDQKR